MKTLKQLFGEIDNIDLLSEAMTSPAPMRWKHGTTVIQAYFKAGGENYEIAFFPSNDGTKLEVEFVGMNSDGDITYDATGKGNALTVFSTVLEAIRIQVDDFQPTFVTFAAHGDVISRKKLYERMVKRFVKDNPGASYKLMHDRFKVRLKPKEVKKAASVDTLDTIPVSLSAEVAGVTPGKTYNNGKFSWIELPYSALTNTDVRILTGNGIDLHRVEYSVWLDLGRSVESVAPLFREFGLEHLLSDVQEIGIG